MSDISNAKIEQLEQGTADKAHWVPPRLSYLADVAQDTQSNEGQPKPDGYLSYNTVS